MKLFAIFVVIICFFVFIDTSLSEEVFNISISPDGIKAVVYKELGIDIINLATQEIILFIPGEDRISSIWSPDSIYLGIAMQDASIQVWNVNAGILATTLIGHPWGSRINALEWYGNQLYSMTFEGSLLIWDMTTYEYTYTLNIGGNDLEINPSGDKLAIASFFNIAILDLNIINVEWLVPQDEQILSVAWSPDGQRLASSFVNGKIQIWNINNKNMPEQIIVANEVPYEIRWITELQWNTGYLAVRQMYNDSVVILDEQTGERLDTILVENGRFIWSGNTGYYATFQNEPIQLHRYCNGITPSGDIAGISQAIIDGNSNLFGNTICLSPNTTYTLTAPLPDITGDITIIGNGATITMTGGNRIFNVLYNQQWSRNGSLMLKNVTLSGGIADEGGAIYNAGDLTLENVTLQNHTAVRGGAIYNTGNLVMNGGVIQNNTATEFGGGIYNLGDMQLDGVTIRQNTAPQGSGVYQGR